MENGCRQGFSRRNRMSDGVEIKIPALGRRVRKHLDIVRRNREKQSRPMAFDDLEHGLRFRRTGQQDAGCSHPQRKIESVAESVSKKKLGYAEKAIVLADVQYRFGVPL